MGFIVNFGIKDRDKIKQSCSWARLREWRKEGNSDLRLGFTCCGLHFDQGSNRGGGDLGLGHGSIFEN